MNDDKECSILVREAPGKDWKLQAHTLKISVAVRSAAQTEAQEHAMGRTRAEAKAIPRADYEAGRFKTQGLKWAGAVPVNESDEADAEWEAMLAAKRAKTQ